jgi:hypothetical protein
MPEDLFETLTLSLSIVLTNCKHNVDPNIVASVVKICISGMRVNRTFEYQLGTRTPQSSNQNT